MIAANFTNTLTFSTIDADAGLAKAFAMKPEAIVEAIGNANLSGRGGAGFPTARKWASVAQNKSTTKYIICNADEGEAGAFKDRLILSDFADLVFAGMTIAGRAVGASYGILYLRGEYFYLKNPLEEVLRKRREQGLLGKSVKGSTGFAYDIEVRLGSGAYVCGEETALIESLEGYRGEPRNRPPYPVEVGLGGKPTVVNNVETYAWAATIIAKGPEWLHGPGGKNRSLPRILSISGDCERPGVYEVPSGFSIVSLIDLVGAPDARAIQIGGAAGYCVPASEFNTVITLEDVATGGSIIVFDKNRDMLEVARNFLEFFAEESCGQCTPCREGTRRLLEGISKMSEGNCSTIFLNDLCDLGDTMRLASKCGLGQSAPNAFLSIVKHFRDDLMGRSSKPSPLQRQDHHQFKGAVV